MSDTAVPAAAARHAAWADLDFELPPDRIAQRPLAERDASRLLCVRRNVPAALAERCFRDLAELLRPGDVVVRNVTRVVPARLRAVKASTGARCELLLLEPAENGGWWALARPGKRLPAGSVVQLDDGTPVTVREVAPDGRRRCEAPDGVDWIALAQRLGALPLPPYIRRPADAADATTYQTVYARVDGSVAAPTAGLHFTPRLLDTLAARGVTFADLVLHVGLATFQPIRSDDPLQHPMHWERFEIASETLAGIDRARAAGGRVVAVGTTVVRALESLAAWESGAGPEVVVVRREATTLHGRTRLFVHPPHEFRRVDALLTNFHLPRTTLLLLVGAFAGSATLRAAYAHAIATGFRFFSYGDAMWIE